MQDVILVVTPARNGADYLEETILSILQQRGDFEIHYHLQDGGSTDATLEITRTWAERLRESGGTFHGGAPVEISWASAPDNSMYDAIQTGFETLFRKLGSLEGRRVLMTWLNTDDIVAIGAFQTVVRYLSENSGRTWVTGMRSLMLEDGTIADVFDPPYAYCRSHLARGRYDGRSRPFFQQEGTFWTASLWLTVGGLNRQLRLAGDWDLWRRMAKETDVVTLKAVLAHHRRRPGQLSGEMDPYWLEVDALKMLDEGHSEEIQDHEDIGWVAGWNPEPGRWTTYAVNMEGAQELVKKSSVDSLTMRVVFSDRLWPKWIQHVSGLSAAEPWGRWSDALLAPSVRVCSVHSFPARAAIRMKLAVTDPRCSPVLLTIGGQRFEIAASSEVQEFHLDIDLDAPADVIDLRPTAAFSPKDQGWSDDSRLLGVAVHELEIAPRPEPASA